MDLAHGREVHLGLDLNEESMEGSDVDDQPTPIVKISSSPSVCQLLSNFVVVYFSKNLR